MAITHKEIFKVALDGVLSEVKKVAETLDCTNLYVDLYMDTAIKEAEAFNEMYEIFAKDHGYSIQFIYIYLMLCDMLK